MKSRGTRRSKRGARPEKRRADQGTRLLAGIAILLMVGILLILVDLWLRPAAGSRVVQADTTTRPALPQTSTPIPSAPAPCTAPADWGTYVVEGGDTLYSLAQRYGGDVKTLARVNCLKGSTILVGQQLYVPGPGALPLEAATGVPGVVAQASPTPEPVATTEVPPEVTLPESRLNIVLLGADIRPKTFKGVWRTDAIVIVSVDVKEKVVRLLHIPRDLWVNVPGHGYDRINTVQYWGELAKEGSGTDLVKQTISENLGIPIDYYVWMDFTGFVNAIDMLGGVDIAANCPLPEINLEPGIYHMDGRQLKEYVRRRDTTSDFDRGRRERQVLMAAWEQLLTPEIIPKLPVLWIKMADTFQTDLPLDQVVALARLGLQLKPQRIRTAALDGQYVEDWITPGGAMVLLLREDQFRQMLDRFYAPIDTARQDRKSKTKVEILNGSQVRDGEQLAAAALRQEGFKIVSTGPAARQYGQTQIWVYKGDLTAAQQVANALGVQATGIQDYTTIPEPPDPSSSVQMRVVLGADYDPCQR